MNAPLPAEIAVVHNPDAQQFEVRLGSELAVCAYNRHADVLDIHHTEVPEALGGRGLAGLLVAATLAWARKQGLRVRPTCSYAAGYMARRPETRDLLAS
jgi:predicted GNAT family acetyltransferase